MSNIDWNPFHSPLFQTAVNTAGSIVSAGAITNAGDIGRSIAEPLFGGTPEAAPAVAAAAPVVSPAAVPTVSTSGDSSASLLEGKSDTQLLLIFVGVALAVFLVLKLASGGKS